MRTRTTAPSWTQGNTGFGPKTVAQKGDDQAQVLIENEVFCIWDVFCGLISFI